MEQIDLTKILKAGDTVFNYLRQKWEAIESFDSKRINTNLGEYTHSGCLFSSHLVECITWKEWHPESGEPFPNWKDYKPQHNFKHGELVWVRNKCGNTWYALFYSHMCNDLHATFVGNVNINMGDFTFWNECLPFNQRPF